MRNSTHREDIDLSKLGGALLIASALVLAIRTARWSARTGQEQTADSALETEIQHAIAVTTSLLGRLLARYPSYFRKQQIDRRERIFEEDIAR